MHSLIEKVDLPISTTGESSDKENHITPESIRSNSQENLQTAKRVSRNLLQAFKVRIKLHFVKF